MAAAIAHPPPLHAAFAALAAPLPFVTGTAVRHRLGSGFARTPQGTEMTHRKLSLALAVALALAAPLAQAADAPAQAAEPVSANPFFTVSTLLRLDDVGAVEADVANMEITVYGQQWWWSYEYDLDGDGEVEIITANELVIPAGTDIELVRIEGGKHAMLRHGREFDGRAARFTAETLLGG